MRRTHILLVSTALVVLLGCVVALLSLVVAPQDQPNVIFVLTDDQFPGTENKMPALKSNVTDQGIKFTNTTSTYPLCCPARAILHRGQYAHNTEIYGNNLPKGGWEKFKNRGLHRSTVATWLDAQGYQTGFFGKFMNNYTDLSIPPGYDRWYAWNSPKMGWRSVNVQGKQKPLARPKADSLVADKTLEFLDNRLKGNAPVFAFVNFGAMHSPFKYAKFDEDKFGNAKVPRTAAFNEADVSDKPSYVRNLPKLSGEKISGLDQDYRDGLRSLMRVDRFVADLTDLLHRRGELDDTYIVFYTDNGAHFGQHRFEHGKFEPYKEDVNFPLIVRGPGIPQGVVNTELIGTHDVAPSLADMADADVPDFVDGRSFLPLATGEVTEWSRTAILSDRGENNGVPSNRWDKSWGWSWEMLRMEDGKVYTRHERGPGEGEKEFYDLEQDPYQLHNALGPADTTYPPPDAATLAYYEKRLDALYNCSGQSGPKSCRAAEDAPLLPGGTSP
jgi:N-acetylglucosamine-6-sulfatase